MLTTVVTNWIGDGGFVRSVSARLKMPVIFGDCNYFKARVTAKRMVDGVGLVDIELWGENQLGQLTIKGSAVAELPCR
jgi:acyl dehydratase